MIAVNTPAWFLVRHASWLAPAALALMVFAMSVGFGLVWDDVFLVQRVRGLLGEGGWWRLLTAEFRLSDEVSLGYYRPVVLASLAFDDLAASGIGFQTFHATNILLHVAVTLLVAALLRHLGFPALLVGLGASLFAVHPAHVESVAFVSGRTDMLALLFILIATVAYVRAKSDDAPRGVVTGGLAFGGFTLALLSKEQAAMLPVALLLLDAFGVTTRGRGRPGWWRRNAVWCAGWLACIAFVALVRVGVAGVGFAGAGRPHAVRDPATAPWSPSWIPGVMATYTRLLVVPWPLNGYYTPDQIVFGPIALGSIVIVAAMVVFSLRSPFAGRGLAGALWMLCFLVPVIGIVPIAGAVLAERYLYAPSVGLCLLVCSAVLAIGRGPWWQRVLGGAGIAAVLTLAALTLARIPVWRNDLTLYADLVATSPRCVECLENLGIELDANGRHSEALMLLERAIELRPTAAKAHNMLGVQLGRMERPLEALPHFVEAARLRPDRVSYQQNLGKALLDLGRFGEAERVFRTAIERAPAEPRSRLGLGLALVGQGHLEEAEHERRVLETRAPDLARQLGVALAAGHDARRR